LALRQPQRPVVGALAASARRRPLLRSGRLGQGLVRRLPSGQGVLVLVLRQPLEQLLQVLLRRQPSGPPLPVLRQPSGQVAGEGLRPLVPVALVVVVRQRLAPLRLQPLGPRHRRREAQPRVASRWALPKPGARASRVQGGDRGAEDVAGTEARARLTRVGTARASERARERGKKMPCWPVLMWGVLERPRVRGVGVWAMGDVRYATVRP
jgi:hypothetical protein